MSVLRGNKIFNHGNLYKKMLLEINWSKYIFTMMNGLVLGVGSGDDAGGWRQGCRFSVWDSRRQNVAVVAKVF